MGALLGATAVLAVGGALVCSAPQPLDLGDSHALALDSSESLPTSCGATAMHGYGPWTESAMYLPLWWLAGRSLPTPRFAPRRSAAPTPPRILNADIRFDGLSRGTATTRVDVEWFAVPATRTVRCSAPASPVVRQTTPMSARDWDIRNAVGYFALPMGTPQDASPHGAVAYADFAMEWPTQGNAAIPTKTVTLFFRHGVINAGYINATFAIGKATRGKPNASIRVDFFGDDSAPNVKWLFEESVLSKPVTAVDVAGSKYDVVEIQMFKFAVEENGKRRFSIDWGPPRSTTSTP